jgi:hypothetical protein
MVRCSLDRHSVEGGAVRAALLDVVIRLGVRLRRRGQAARALTLKFAGDTSWRGSAACRSRPPTTTCAGSPAS